MVAISRALLFTMAASFSALVSADNCKPGLFYCGTVLLRKGVYSLPSTLSASPRPLLALSLPLLTNPSNCILDKRPYPS